MFFELSLEIVLILFFVALFAGFIDTLAGGGGLLTTPALILAGLPPLMALGTNKLQAVAGSATASFMMIKKKKVTIKEVKSLFLFAFLGSALGTIIIQFIDISILNIIIPLVLFFIGIYFLFMPNVQNIQNKKEKMSQNTYAKTIVPLIGTYDGMFGPGTGSFFSLSAIALRAKELIKATALAKVMNFGTNLASIIIFIIYGQVAFYIGFIMMIGQLIGAYFGANTLMKINPNYLRAIVVFMCFTMLIKYILNISNT